MKKLFAGIVLMTVILSGVSASAAEYNAEDNSISSIDGDKYQTVLIIRDTENTTDEDIVYIGQAESGFTATAEFLLKDKPEAGWYLLKLGRATGAADTTRIYIGVPISGDYVSAGKTFKEEGSVAFGWESVSCESCRTVILRLDDKTYGYDFGTTLSGPGELNLGVEITGIPSDVQAVSAYISGKSLSDLTSSGTTDSEGAE